MAKRTPLHAAHVALGARMVDFAGWDMPLHYGSQVEEHHRVRRGAGVFDVSHMGIVDLTGARTRDFLRYLLANDVARVDASPGKAIYSCMLNDAGGVLDDLIVYHMDPIWYRVVVNAGTRERDLAWIRRHAEAFAVEVNERDELAMVAVQGPQGRELAHRVLAEQAGAALGLARFQAATSADVFIARTGYTGEDGYEIMLPGQRAEELWQALLDAGAAPCGLGARDTLRLEAGMNLYGQDMDEQVTPLESGLTWTVAFDPPGRDFVGRAALERRRSAGVDRRLVGLLLEGRGVLRPHQRVLLEGGGEGEVTSGSFSPTLERSIAFARIPAGEARHCEVEVRGRLLPARIVRPPFVRNGSPAIET